MNPSKPEWYTMLKQEPFVIRTFDPKPCMEQARQISGHVGGRTRMNRKRYAGLAATLVLTVLLVVLIPQIHTRLQQDPAASPSQLPYEVPEYMYKDPNWKVSQELVEIYQAYARNPKEGIEDRVELIAGRAPLDILKLFYLSVRFGNEEAQRQILTPKAEGGQLPDRDQFMIKWWEWTKNYYFNEMVNGQAAILTLLPDDESSADYRNGGPKEIRLTRNASGVWQLEAASIKALLDSK